MKEYAITAQHWVLCCRSPTFRNHSPLRNNSASVRFVHEAPSRPAPPPLPAPALARISGRISGGHTCEYVSVFVSVLFQVHRLGTCLEVDTCSGHLWTLACQCSWDCFLLNCHSKTLLEPAGGNLVLFPQEANVQLEACATESAICVALLQSMPSKMQLHGRHFIRHDLPVLHMHGSEKPFWCVRPCYKVWQHVDGGYWNTPRQTHWRQRCWYAPISVPGSLLFVHTVVALPCMLHHAFLVLHIMHTTIAGLQYAVHMYYGCLHPSCCCTVVMPMDR